MLLYSGINKMEGLVRRGILSLFLLSIVGLFIVVNNVEAQDIDLNKESITLSPAINKPTTEPGAIISDKLTILNTGKTEYRFLLYAGPYSVKQETYDPNYTEVNDRTEAYQWVQFEKTDIVLKAGEQIVVPYTVKVPSNVQSGGHYAVLFAETQPKLIEGTQVARKKRVGSLVYLTVDGDINKSGSMVDWDVPLWQTKRPIAGQVRIKNDGNVHFQANSTIKFKNIFGRTVLTHNQEHIILPGTTRRISSTLERSLPVGIYKASGGVDFLEKNNQLTSKWIVLLPIPAILGLLGLAILFILYKLYGRYKKRRRGVKITHRGKK